MTNATRLTAALVLSLAATCTAPPAFARAAPGFNSHLEVIGPQLAADTAQRMALIRACNAAAAPLREYTWGNEQSDRYRACMAEHGQME